MWSSLLSTGAHIYLSRHAGHLQKEKKISILMYLINVSYLIYPEENESHVPYFYALI